MGLDARKPPDFVAYAGLYLAIFGKGPWPKLGKNYRLNVKIGKNYRHKTQLWEQNSS